MEKQVRSSFSQNRGMIWMSLACILVSLTGCGKTAFIPTPITNGSVAPGSISIAPNIDVMVVVDDTGSMYGVIDELKKEVPGFLNGLVSRKLNFHFTVVPLTTYRPVQQVAGSIYDSNYGSAWVPPYAGARSDDRGMIPSAFFRTPETFSDYISGVSNFSLGKEPGLENIVKILKEGTSESQFFRTGPNGEEQSFTAVLMLGNGNDTSRINYCSPSGSAQPIPCEILGNPTCKPTADDPTGGSKTCGSTQTSMDYFVTEFKKIRKNMKFYAAVAQQSPTCRKYPATKGSRYNTFATRTEGAYYDLCNLSVDEILDKMTANLETVKITLKTRFLFIDQDADESSIVVYRYINGDPNNAVRIPKNDTNGWTYVRDAKDETVVYNPMNNVAMSTGSGFGIRLNGTAELSGADTAGIEFEVAGSDPAHSD